MNNVVKYDPVESVVTMKVKWYVFDQNNSGGRYVQDDNQSELVFVQAVSAAEANDFAHSNFDYGYCECCGERWSDVDESDSADFPAVWGTEHIYSFYYEPFETCYGHTHKKWRIGQVATLVFYDGHIEKYTLGDKPIERIPEPVQA